MIAKVVLFLAVVAAAHASLIGVPVYMGRGIVTSGYGVPLVRAPIVAAPVVYGKGLVSPVRLGGAGIIAGPGVVKGIYG